VVSLIRDAIKTGRTPLVPGRNGPVPVAVLVVDDDRDSADSLALVLRLQGFDARPAYDADGTLAAVVEFRPQAILLDLAMPGTDGYALADRIRREVNCRPVLLAVTGLGDAAERARTRAAGFGYHFVKPVDPGVLVGVLRAHADRPG
jgi:DNA-binding response OmpR family regulator